MTRHFRCLFLYCQMKPIVGEFHARWQLRHCIGVGYTVADMREVSMLRLDSFRKSNSLVECKVHRMNIVLQGIYDS